MPGETKQRIHDRQPFKKTMQIKTPSHHRDADLIAIGSNISVGGICIYTFKSLSEGDEIIISESLPIPHHRARVIWVKQCNRSIYKVGVKFTP